LCDELSLSHRLRSMATLGASVVPRGGPIRNGKRELFIDEMGKWTNGKMRGKITQKKCREDQH